MSRLSRSAVTILSASRGALWGAAAASHPPLPTAPVAAAGASLSGFLEASPAAEVSAVLARLFSSGPSRSPQSQPPSAAASQLLDQYLNPALLSSMERHRLDLKRIRETFRRHDGDCGSSEVQIALLTERIRYMNAHLTQHKKDKHSRVGLDGMLARRKKLLKYLRRTDWDSYCRVISTLGLRDRLDLQR